jgi:hypothetical protein
MDTLSVSKQMKAAENREKQKCFLLLSFIWRYYTSQTKPLNLERWTKFNFPALLPNLGGMR